jgi:anti-anti-sigma factor
MTATPFRIDGEFTIYRAAELAEGLKAALAALAPGQALAIELSEVTEMDSAGVQLLLAARRSAREGGRALHLGGRSPAVAEVLATLRLDTHFDDAAAAAQAD